MISRLSKGSIPQISSVWKGEESRFFSEKEKIVFDPADVAFGSKCLSEFPLAEVVQDESFAEEISTFNDKDVEK